MANKPEPPAPWIVIGVVLTAFGAGLFVADFDNHAINTVGAILAVVGGFITQIAVIAAGVSWGMRRFDWQQTS